MRTSIVCFLMLGLALTGMAQFYPDAKAVWFGVDDNGGPPGFDVVLVMNHSPDTLINGTVYKKISEYNDASGIGEFKRHYYVRSEPNGKGYVYLPDSLAEFVSGDLSAQAGDTVHGVLVSLTTQDDIFSLLSGTLEVQHRQNPLLTLV